MTSHTAMDKVRRRVRAAEAEDNAVRLAGRTAVLAGGAIAGLVAVLLSLWLWQVWSFRTLKHEWAQQERQVATRQVELSRLGTLLGFGGFIHDFKNFLLRREGQYATALAQDIDEIAAAIRAYRDVANLTGEEAGALDVIAATARKYLDAVRTIEVLAAAGADIEEIDRQVRISDAGAEAALKRLEDNLVAERAVLGASLDRKLNRFEDLFYLSLLVSAVFAALWIVLFQVMRRALRGMGEAVRSNRQLVALTEAASDAIVTIGTDNRVRSFNCGAEAIFGYAAGEICGGPFDRLLPDDMAARNAGLIRAFAAAPDRSRRLGSAGAIQARRKDGRRFPAIASITKAGSGEEMLMSVILRDVSVEAAREADLAEALLAAEAASEARFRFLASMSHEIRTPLNAVLGFLDILLSEANTGFVGHCAGRARGAASSLLQIIDDILDYARIERSGVGLAPEAGLLRTTIGSVVSLVEPLWQDKGLAFALHVAEDLPEAVLLDHARLKQVLLNVVVNAVKYTDRGSVTVTVAGREAGDTGMRLAIQVQDTGHGMAAGQLRSVFQPFSRGAHIGIEGTGLGLAITKAIVDSMGGTIRIDSQEGRGTLVELTVPVVPADPADLPGPPILSDSRPAIPSRILVAEDNLLSAEVIEAILLRNGHQVTLVGDGQAALDALVQPPGPSGARYDLVLMDVQMPGLDGVETTRRIRACGAPQSAVPIVGLTAFVSQEDRQRCLDAGMDSFLTKPVNVQDLYAAIDRLTAAGPADMASAAAPAQGAQAIDVERIQTLIDTMGADRAGDYLSRAFEGLRARIDGLDAGAGTPGAVAERLHDIVSVAGTLGLLGLSSEVRALMQLCRINGIAEVRQDLPLYQRKWSGMLPGLEGIVYEWFRNRPVAERILSDGVDR